MLIIWRADFGWLTYYLNWLLISLEAQQRLGLLFAVLSFSQRRWKNEKVFPASYSCLDLPTALYHSPLSCQRRIPAAVESRLAPPRCRMRVSLGIFNANSGLISVCVNTGGFCGWLLFSFSESMFMNVQKQAAGLALMQWVSAFILWLESCAESLLKSQTAWDALICNSTAGVSFSIWTFFKLQTLREYLTQTLPRELDVVHRCILKCTFSKLFFRFWERKSTKRSIKVTNVNRKLQGALVRQEQQLWQTSSITSTEIAAIQSYLRHINLFPSKFGLRDLLPWEQLSWV